MKLTEQNIIDGAAMAVKDPEYDQTEWCHCIWHYAQIAAGLKPVDNRGPVRDELPDTPRGRMYYSMIRWTHADTAALVPYVGENGLLRVPEGGIGDFKPRAEISPQVVIGVDAQIGPDAVIKSGTMIWSGAKIGADAQIGPDAVIGVGARVGPGALVGPGEQTGPGAYTK